MAYGNIVAAEKIRAEGWDYPAMLLRHTYNIAEKAINTISNDQAATTYNLLALQGSILTLDALLNENPILPPVPLNTKYMMSKNPLENYLYFEALIAWLRKVCASFDQYGIKPYPTIEEGLDEDL